MGACCFPVTVTGWPKPVPCSHLVLLGREVAGSGWGAGIGVSLLAEAQSRVIDLCRDAPTSQSGAQLSCPFPTLISSLFSESIFPANGMFPK